MRSFPRTVRRWASAALVAVLAAGAVGVPAAQAEDRAATRDRLTDRHQQVERAERRAHHELERSSQELHAATGALRRAQQRLGTARTELARVQRRLDLASAAHLRAQQELADQRAELTVARERLRAGAAEVARQEDELRGMILDSYQGGDPRLVALSGLVSGESSIADLTRAQAYERDATTNADQQLRRFEAAQVLLAVQEREVARITDQVAAGEQRAAGRVDRIAGLRSETAAGRDRVAALVASRRAAQQRAVTLRARDLRELQQLRRQESRLRVRMFRASAGAANRRVGTLDGTLFDPVSGPVTSPFGMRRHPIHGYLGLHNGTDFGAGCGTPLRAVETGRVIARYHSAVWGNRVYLNLGRINGHGYTAVYNHLSSVGVGAGAVVPRGARIGRVGTTGWSTGCHLHFTLLRDGRPIDPTALL